MTTPEHNRTRSPQLQDLNELSVPSATEQGGSLLGSLPRRAFDVAAEVTKRVGLATALMTGGAGMGLPEQQADAGIITHLDYDPLVRALGEGYAIDNGGNVGYIQNDVGFASGVGWNQNGFGWVLTAGHVALNRGALTFGTGTNFNSSPGTNYATSEVFLHPLYTDGGDGIDLALLRLNSQIAGAGQLSFATSRPANNSEVGLAGYGTAGSSAGYTTQDGFIRAGTSRLVYGSRAATIGFSPDIYGVAVMQTFFGPPTTLRGAPGDSGGGLWAKWAPHWHHE